MQSLSVTFSKLKLNLEKIIFFQYFNKNRLYFGFAYENI